MNLNHLITPCKPPYEFEQSYNTIHATRLLQHNNSPQNQLQISQVQCLQVLKSNKVIFITSN